MCISIDQRQAKLFILEDTPILTICETRSFRTQLLKWVGNKQQQADKIISYFPNKFGTYFEPFLGSGGVLGTLAPKKAIASDIFMPLMQIWQTLHNNSEELKNQYAKRYALIAELGKQAAYKQVLANYNARPNGADLLFLCRTCYGGVVRFRKNDGFMSTPVGVHDPISSENFSNRVDIWHERTQRTTFLHTDFADAMALAQAGDLIYCDPPYVDSQTILYGAQAFSLQRLFDYIALCKTRGVFIVLSIDGIKYSGRKLCNIAIPKDLFKREVLIDVGRSMLKRFQMNGSSLENHEVKDRLLLTF